MIFVRLLEVENNSIDRSNDFIVARHGKDYPCLTQTLNQPLIPEAAAEIIKLAEEIIDFYAFRGVYNGIKIYSSIRIRALQTSDILSEAFAQSGISTEIIASEEIREMHQGHFIIKDYIEGDDYSPLVNAWKVFQEKLKEGDILYRFGDPLKQSDGNVKYPALADFFAAYGENQREFSLRLYAFLKNFFSEKSTKLQLIVTHQATVSRIQRIISVLSRAFDADSFKAGDLVHRLERAGDRVSIEPACGVVILKPDIGLSVKILEKELVYLNNHT